MANHGFISSKKNLKEDQVLKDLQEINQRRFKGLLKIEDSQWGDKGSWFISYQDKDWEHPIGFNIWVRSARKLEHRHSSGWGFYLEIVFSSELGALYSGKISDECCAEKWDPDPKKYPTYKSWLEEWYGLKNRKKISKLFCQQIIKKELKYIPKQFRDL